MSTNLNEEFTQLKQLQADTNMPIRALIKQEHGVITGIRINKHDFRQLMLANKKVRV